MTETCNCLKCGAQFAARPELGKRYCSEKCRKAAERTRWERRRGTVALTDGQMIDRYGDMLSPEQIVEMLRRICHPDTQATVASLLRFQLSSNTPSNGVPTGFQRAVPTPP
jgi:hypothetical protein